MLFDERQNLLQEFPRDGLFFSQLRNEPRPVAVVSGPCVKGAEAVLRSF